MPYTYRYLPDPPGQIQRSFIGAIWAREARHDDIPRGLPKLRPKAYNVGTMLPAIIHGVEPSEKCNLISPIQTKLESVSCYYV